MELKDKIAVITGGASGIGLGIGKAIHRQGGTILLADIDAEKAEAEAEKIGDRASAAHVDAAKTESVEALAQTAWRRYGRVDIFVNNAGVGGGGRTVMDVDPRDVDWMIEVNFKGTWRGISIFGGRMREQDTPSVICVLGSENSLGYVNQGLGVYAGTKHAVLGMCDVLRHELPDHMKVCVVFPGLVNTNISSMRHRPSGPLSEKAAARTQAFMALGMSPEEAGEKIAAGIMREDFIIPTHPHVVKLAEKRWNEIAETFAAHEPYTPEAEKYNVEALIKKAAGR